MRRVQPARITDHRLETLARQLATVGGVALTGPHTLARIVFVYTLARISDIYTKESDDMILTIVLVWSLAHACPLVNHYRSQGYSDEQIEQYARAHDIPEWIIKIAKARCTK